MSIGANYAPDGLDRPHSLEAPVWRNPTELTWTAVPQQHSPVLPMRLGAFMRLSRTGSRRNRLQGYRCDGAGSWL